MAVAFNLLESRRGYFPLKPHDARRATGTFGAAPRRLGLRAGIRLRGDAKDCTPPYAVAKCTDRTPAPLKGDR